MGNLEIDTAVERVDEHRYRARLSDDWEIWGPAGGYVAGVALRAAQASSRFTRPATCSVHFLGVAAFDEVELNVEVLRASRRAESLRVSMTQDGRRILEALVWAVGDDQLERDHRFGTHDLPHHRDLPTMAERLADRGEDGPPPHSFFTNLESKPVSWIDDWENRPALDPVTQTWQRFTAVPVSEDPWLEAARLLLLVDLHGWPAASRAHPDHGDPWYAPSLDVSCQFADLSTTEWLLSEHRSPVAAGGLLNAEGRVWSEDGRLLATGITQLLATPIRR